MKRAVLIGLGMVSRTHLDALRDARGVTLHGLLGRDPARTAATAEAAEARMNHPVRAYADLAELVSDRDIDFAILATPPDARIGYIRALTEAGIPILCEKPLERTLAAAREIVALCDARRVPLGVVFQHRARAASQALQRMVHAGDLGALVSAEIRVPWWRDQDYYDVAGRGTRERDGGGVMITQAIHTLDLALWLVGPVARLQALMHTTPLHRMECEDWAAAIFETEAGVVGTLLATTAAFPGGSESITLQGSAARAHLEGGSLRLTRRDGREEIHGAVTATGGGGDPMAFTHDWHQTVLERFAAALDGDGAPLATGEDALRTHAVIDAMERASRSGSWQAVAGP